MQARYYDPVIGRFYSNDPVDAIRHLSNAEGIKGFNRYSYAINNPYKYTDPDGKAICGGVCVTAVAIGAREGAKACVRNAACRGAVVKGANQVAKGAKKVADAVSSVLGSVFNEASDADGESTNTGSEELSAEEIAEIDKRNKQEAIDAAVDAYLEGSAPNVDGDQIERDRKRNTESELDEQNNQ